jgi:hypothetical protein
MPRSTTPAVVVSPKTCWRPCLCHNYTSSRRVAVTRGSHGVLCHRELDHLQVQCSCTYIILTAKSISQCRPYVSPSYIFPPQLAIGWAPPRPCAGRVSAGQRFRGRAVVAPVPPPGHRLIRSPSTGESEQVAERRAHAAACACVCLANW